MSSQRPCHGIGLVAMAMLLPLGVGAADSAPPKAKGPVPADFLEYLSALEGADDNWTDFEVVDVQPPPRNTKTVAPKAAKAVESK